MATKRVADDVAAERLGICLEDAQVLRPKKGFPASWFTHPENAPLWFRTSGAAAHANVVRERLAAEREAETSVAFAARIVSNENTLEHVVIHTGPTNSGKTFDGLRDLVYAGSGVYAAPLRMLAREAYDTLRAELGDDRVGLITGEERINEHAPIVAATAEAAPLTGELLVLDEAHWINDQERGWAWTRLLIAGRYRRIHVACDASAVGTISRLVSDADTVNVIDHARFSQLQYVGGVNMSQIPNASAVVAFSRKAVLALADLAKRQGRNPAVLYGALPPDARRQQVELIVSGDADVIITTDVIGHGINLPISTVVFAETNKFDGVERRSLMSWEAAQIAGRAGRFGLHEQGGVGFLTNVSWAKPNTGVVRVATQVANGEKPSNIRYGRPEIRPTYHDLGNPNIGDIPIRLAAWTRAISPYAVQLNVCARDMHESVDLLKMLIKTYTVATIVRHVSAPDLWRTITAPVSDVGLIGTYLGVALTDPVATRKLTTMMENLTSRNNESYTLETLEGYARQARDLRALSHALALPDMSLCSPDRMAQAENQLSSLIIRKLADTPSHGYGSCRSCEKTCAPWFTECDSCHRSGWVDWDDGYGSYTGSGHHVSTYYANETENQKKKEWWAKTRETSQTAIDSFVAGDTVGFTWKGFERTGKITKKGRTRLTILYLLKSGEEQTVVLHAARCEKKSGPPTAGGRHPDRAQS